MIRLLRLDAVGQPLWHKVWVAKLALYLPQTIFLVDFLVDVIVEYIIILLHQHLGFLTFHLFTVVEDFVVSYGTQCHGNGKLILQVKWMKKVGNEWIISYIYTVPDPYRCIPDLVADPRPVYTQNASIVAFFGTAQVCDAPLIGNGT